jgi:photosystem II stability/assembly factor-like uncharacterized protein
MHCAASATCGLFFALLASCANAPTERDADPSAVVSWSVQSIGGDVSLRAVSAPNEQVVWASGSKGTVIRTVDAGASWVRCAPPDATALDFRSLVAFDANRAVIASAGTPARVYRTDNGGSSWLLAHEDAREAAFFDAIAFADDERGYLIADPIEGALPWMETRDGGVSWQAIPAAFLPKPHDGEAMFAASCSCVGARGDDLWVVTGGMKSRLLSSSSRGRGFASRSLPMLQGVASQGAFSIASVGEHGLVVVGGDYRDEPRGEGSACWSDDDGATWHASAGSLAYRSAVATTADGALCVAVGPSGTSVSRDEGRSFSIASPIGFHAIAIQGTLLVAVGSEGRIGIAALP